MLRRRTQHSRIYEANVESIGRRTRRDDLSPSNDLRGRRVRQLRRVLAVLRGLTWLLLLAALLAVIGQSVFWRMGE